MAAATTEIYTLSLHDALPISARTPGPRKVRPASQRRRGPSTSLTRSRDGSRSSRVDRKSTRLNSSHEWISYAVFCLKKKNIEHTVAVVECVEVVGNQDRVVRE